MNAASNRSRGYRNPKLQKAVAYILICVYTVCLMRGVDLTVTNVFNTIFLSCCTTLATGFVIDAMIRSAS